MQKKKGKETNECRKQGGETVLSVEVYKKKTEAAKKDYLKALAIYRASIVSKGASEGEGMYGQYGGYGGGYSGYSPPAGMPSPTNPPHIPQQQHMQPQQQQMTTMAKKSPLLTNMMNERGQNGPSPQQGMMGSPMGSPMGHMGPQPHLQNQNSGYMQQMTPSSSMQQQQQQQQQQHGNINLNASNGEEVNGPGAGGLGVDGGVTGNHCIRHGCTNPAITSTEWEDEYCSNECVVGHCSFGTLPVQVRRGGHLVSRTLKRIDRFNRSIENIPVRLHEKPGLSFELVFAVELPLKS
ncbi:hypothetical protein RUM44_007917 [Polyplax serrata]|uniref:TOX high mobility group box family member 4 n=1 Tax=Polyplax serrata TaxID=468196 RepID=A0ABR1B7G8_POLSC